MRAALGKKPIQQQQEATLIDCLSSTLTLNSNVMLMCCVSPAPYHFDHSLPAIKFCARIRDCIIKRLKRDSNIDESNPTTLESARRAPDRFNGIREVLDKIREEF